MESGQCVPYGGSVFGSRASGWNGLLVISGMAWIVRIRDGNLMIDMAEELVASSCFRTCVLSREGFVDCYLSPIKSVPGLSCDEGSSRNIRTDHWAS